MTADSPPSPALRPLQVGEPAPTFVAKSDTSLAFDFSTVAGCWTVLLFFGTLSVPQGREAHDRILARRALFDDQDAMFFGVSIDPADKTAHGLANSMPGLRYFWDFDRAVSRAYGAVVGPALRPTAVLLDRAGRVAAVVPASRVDSLLDLLQRQVEADRLSQPEQFAPVLCVPRIFEPEFCAALIGYYAADGGKRSGYMTERDGRTVAVTDDRHKRRSDVYVQDEGLQAQLKDRVVHRLLPMIDRAFGWRPSRFERYLISCYSGEERGFFFPHRDNATAGTAHRRLAVTVNLNAEDHEGGALRFPEFGGRLYKPPTGGAVVFGCGLMHEATPVTAGVRYAFLPFLYDEEGERLRAANRAKVETTAPDTDTRLG
ncbi:MAG TPA: 2OG-Fe(II) oxygenase [Caulobacteraceae bacterium]|jgi:peroxiredoxin/predicted 2-oxoglutarate/Fe(II)-dependent dioxygenase YbiX|nr:2OG-Fe(II) oxygenase [Caulobacteraceae bacterium]